MPPRCRRDKPRAGQALQHDPGLLVLRPATTPARLDDLKPPEGTVRMTVHTHCSQREEHPAARRPSPDGNTAVAPRDDSSWRDILTYFEPSYQLGMTATPLRDDNHDTYRQGMAQLR